MSERVRALPNTTSSPWAFGAGVIGIALLLQVLPTILFHPQDRVIPRFIYWLVQAPLLIGALLVAYRVAQKQNLSTLSALFLCMLVAIAVGAFAGMLSHHIVLALWGPDALPGPPGAAHRQTRSIFFGSMGGLFTAGFWALGFVYPATLEAQRTLRLEQEHIRLERQALRTQSALHQLRARLEPHFLLNTLNAISGLITQDPREARRLIATLGDLLSDTLADDELQPLTKELSWLRGYGNLLQSRFREQLTIDWQVESDTESTLIPHLLLQPLVENAVSHGALCAGHGGHVTVALQLDQDKNGRSGLSCHVTDNGPGFDESRIRAGAFGIAAVRRRLALWDTEASLDFESVPGKTVARLWLPQKAAA